MVNEMTDIEQLASQTIEHVETCFQFGYDHKIIIDRALAFAYALGRTSVNTPARVQAARKNGAKNDGAKSTGRPKGAKDNKPRKPGRWAHKTNETNETEMKP